jgi:hypothetical protein
MHFATCAAADDARPPIGYDALLRIDQLPLLTDWPAYQDSSYSRKNDNHDEGNFLRVEPNGEQVLVDTDGPGVVYRIWSTGVVGRQMSDRCRFRFYFDGEKKPRIDRSVPELFGAPGSTYPFVPPLAVTFESGATGNPAEGSANLSYVPIPFRKHLKITGREIAFYHVDYLKLPPGTDLQSWSPHWALSQRPRHERAARLFEHVGADPKPKRAEVARVWHSAGWLFPAGTLRLTIEGPGVIDALRVKLSTPTPSVLRGLAVSITFDDAPRPSVLTPLGDFFGSGGGNRRFRSLLSGMTEEGYYSYWPMPFARQAIVELVNDSPAAVVVDALQVTEHAVRKHPPNFGYFHARYVQDPDCALGRDYTILRLTGHRGKYVGTNITMQNARGGRGIFFLEGDKKIYCDGEHWPSRWLGTGTEDYYNGAYFWNHPDKTAMARPLGGLTFLDWDIGRVCAYRWQVPDCVSFRHDIRVDQEHGPVSGLPTNYQSVAYYYLDAPVAQEPLPTWLERLLVTPLPPVPPFVCCTMQGPLTRNGRPLARHRFYDEDPEYEVGADTMQFASASAGDRILGSFGVPGEDNFRVVLLLSGGPDYGPLEVLLDGTRVGRADARRPKFQPWLECDLGTRQLAGGIHRLELKVPAEHGASVGFVALQLRPTSPLIRTWNVIGTWPCPKDGGPPAGARAGHERGLRRTGSRIPSLAFGRRRGRSLPGRLECRLWPLLRLEPR